MNLNSHKRVAVDAAVMSGDLIKRSLGKIKTLSYKGRDNLVTDVDERSESMIINKIRSNFPDHSILSEEGAPKKSGSPYRWIIDPLDGTTNFIHAFPFFSVSIALELFNKVILAVIYEPLRKELFFAETDKGASLNGKRISVSKTKRISQSFLATGFGYGKEGKERNLKHFGDFLLSALAVRRAGSAALDLAYVACGRFDGFWEMDLHPWDTAAGSLIVEESGGFVTKFDGSTYALNDKEIVSSNSNIHREMIRILQS